LVYKAGKEIRSYVEVRMHKHEGGVNAVGDGGGAFHQPATHTNLTVPDRQQGRVPQ